MIRKAISYDCRDAREMILKYMGNGPANKKHNREQTVKQYSVYISFRIHSAIAISVSNKSTKYRAKDTIINSDCFDF